MKKRMRKLAAMLLAIAFLVPIFGFSPERGGDEIKWRSSRKLEWDDFRGRPDRTSHMDALTESGISFSWSCDSRGFTADIYAMFVPSRSWVRKESKALLVHEQAHFDITEIHARRMRKHFGEMRNPCALSQRLINSAAEKIMKASAQMQHRYDRETNHSMNEEAQREWLDYISDELSDLSNWAQ